MVITNILGGLGNQMFQYAFGKSLSIEFNIPLKLDLSGFQNYKLHQGYELKRIFNIPETEATRKDYIQTLGWKGIDIFRKFIVLKNYPWISDDRFIIQKVGQSAEEIKILNKNKLYLYGYWQSEKYFSSILNIIRKTFIFPKPISDENLRIIDRIKSTNSVSLHIRRGDYVNLKWNLPIDYYKNSIEYLGSRFTDLNFFIFSDDIKWARENFKISHNAEYLDHNRDEKSFVDMQLMSLCKYHIIANSSFSWWSAWLDPYPKKIVIASKSWWPDLSDLIPVSWIII